MYIEKENKRYCDNCNSFVDTYSNICGEHYEICCCECDELLDED